MQHSVASSGVLQEMAAVSLVQLARHVAIGAHRGQCDHSGLPYWLHPMRVAESVRRAGYGAEHQAVAWMHDVVEDTALTLSHLCKLGFPDVVVIAVNAITRIEKGPDRMSVRQYYSRVMGNAHARIVKRYDLLDNMRVDRGYSAKDQERSRRKYYAKLYRHVVTGSKL